MLSWAQSLLAGGSCAIPRARPPLFATASQRTQRVTGVARVTLNRPEKRNAQNMQMTYDINAAFDYACLQPHIKVIVLAAVVVMGQSYQRMKADATLPQAQT